MNIFENFSQYYKVLQEVYHNDTLTLVPIQNRLLNVIHDQLVEASSNDDLKNGIYLQVALSDELFLEKNVAGWKDQMLEHQVFNTQHAGEKIHQDLKDIMQSPFEYNRDMLYVYFLILAFGFKGDLTKASIQKYKAHLAQILFPQELFQDKDTHLIPENFNFTQKHPPVGYVPDIYLWLRISGFLLLLYVLATSFYWFMLQKEMKDMVRVLESRVKVERVNTSPVAFRPFRRHPERSEGSRAAFTIFTGSFIPLRFIQDDNRLCSVIDAQDDRELTHA